MDETTRLRMRRAHAQRGHLCLCGRYVRGNGGQYNHRRACPKLVRYRTFHHAGGKLSQLPTVMEFVWTRRTDLTYHPDEAAYKLAQTSSDLLV